MTFGSYGDVVGKRARSARRCEELERDAVGITEAHA
jgi:hypothetical protein